MSFGLAGASGLSSPQEGVQQSVLNAETSLAHACSLLELDSAQTLRALTTRQLQTGRESITVFLSATACGDNRDALAKAMYESLFLSLISKINATLQLHSPKNPRLIGVLDIFGFEVRTHFTTRHGAERHSRCTAPR